MDARQANPSSAQAPPGQPQEVSRKGVVRLVAGWIADGEPGAVVRFGEGEGRLLGADPGDPLSMTVAAKKLRRQTGLSLTADDVLEIKARILRALDEADVVGIRGSDSFSEEHKMWMDRIEAVFQERIKPDAGTRYICHCLVNNSLRDALPSLLTGAPRVSVISCRDLAPHVRANYGIDDVRVYQVPSQYIMRRVDGQYEAAMHHVPIWPVFYRRLHDAIRVREPGEIFLVGAGLFGKELCVRVRELGGIALDLGSCLDGLVGKVTRGRHRPSPYAPG